MFLCLHKGLVLRTSKPSPLFRSGETRRGAKQGWNVTELELQRRKLRLQSLRSEAPELPLSCKQVRFDLTRHSELLFTVNGRWGVFFFALRGRPFKYRAANKTLMIQNRLIFSMRSTWTHTYGIYMETYRWTVNVIGQCRWKTLLSVGHLMKWAWRRHLKAAVSLQISHRGEVCSGAELEPEADVFLLCLWAEEFLISWFAGHGCANKGFHLQGMKEVPSHPI